MPGYSGASAKDLLGKAERLFANDANWHFLWQELTEFLNPRKSDVLFTFTPGVKRTSSRLYDSTGPDAASTLASSIHGSLSSPTSRWWTMEFESEELKNDEDANLWLERAADRHFKELQGSNWDSEVQEAYYDIVTVGTCNVLVESQNDPARPGNWGGFIFKTLPIGHYAITVDADGSANGLWRKILMPAQAVVDKFPDTVSGATKKIAEKRPFENVEILHCIYRREGIPLAPKRYQLAKKMPWASCWVEKAQKLLLEESGYKDFPAAIARWSTQSGERYGRGPGEIALPDIKTLNEAVKSRLQAWALSLRPPMMRRHRGVIGRVSLKPKAIIDVRDTEALKPVDFGTRFDTANFQEKDMVLKIQSMFFNDKLQLPNKSIITATEANQRVRQMQRILGPALGRLDSELLRKVISLTWLMMLRAGQFDPIPDQVLEEAKKYKGKIRVTFVGPLARAQRVQDLEALQEFVNAVVPLAQFDPEVLDNVDFDAYVAAAGTATSVSKMVLRSEKQRKKIRDARRAAAAKAQQNVAMREDAIAAGRAAPFIEAVRPPSSALDQQVSAGGV